MYKITGFTQTFPSHLTALAALMRSCRKQHIECVIASSHDDVINCVLMRNGRTKAVTIEREYKVKSPTFIHRGDDIA